MCTSPITCAPVATNTFSGIGEGEVFIWSGIFVSAAFIAVFGFHKFGFIYTAPIFALSIMFLLGEKRILWLLLGVFLVPFLIWLTVQELLGHSSLATTQVYLSVTADHLEDAIGLLD